MKRTATALGILTLVLLVHFTVTGHARPAAAQAGGQTGKGGGSASSTSVEAETASVWNQPSTLELFIFVIDVDSVNSANQNFAASVFYLARWNSPLLRHEGPNPITRNVSEVWAPQLTIVNQQQSWSAFPNLVQISPNGDVVLRQKVWGWYSQPLDLRNFPLDRQTLTIHLAAVDLPAEAVTVVPLVGDRGQASGIAKRFSLPDFEIVSFNAEPRPYMAYEEAGGIAGFVMEIELKRGVEFYIWKIILPICLIVVMSWLPRWIEAREVGTNIGISTTAFLTLVAYLFAIVHLLPPVSYFTRMDQFILLSTIVVFIGLLQTVTASIMSMREVRQSRISRMEVWSRPVYPVGLAAILLVSFWV